VKRRGFFGALTGLIAAPVMAKAVSEIPEAKPWPQPDTKFEPPDWSKYDDATCCTAPYMGPYQARTFKKITLE